MSERAAIAALLITTEGTATELTLDPAARRGILSGMYQAIGCDTVEPVTLADDLTVWFDENALAIADPESNGPVTFLLADVFHLTHQIYYGAAVFTGGVDANGDTLGLAPEHADLIRRYIAA